MHAQFKKGDRVIHYKGNPYIILGISNQSADRDDFPVTVTYCREGADPSDDKNWYSKTLVEFAKKFVGSKPKERFNQHSDGTIEIVLGTFNSPNAKGDIYLANPDDIEKFLQGRIGKDVGEMNFPRYEEGTDAVAWISRILTVVGSDSSGMLADYDIVLHDQKNVDGSQPFSVVGRVYPSAKLDKLMETGAKPIFGIRCLTQGKIREIGKSTVHHVQSMVSFDLTLECPRI